MIFAPGGNTQPLNGLTYLPAMTADAVSRERERDVCISAHVYLCSHMPLAKRGDTYIPILKTLLFFYALYVASDRCKSRCQIARVD